MNLVAGRPDILEWVVDAVLMAVEHTRAFGHWLHTQNMIVEFQDLCNFQRIALQFDFLHDRKESGWVWNQNSSC